MLKQKVTTKDLATKSEIAPTVNTSTTRRSKVLKQNCTKNSVKRHNFCTKMKVEFCILLVAVLTSSAAGHEQQAVEARGKAKFALLSTYLYFVTICGFDRTSLKVA